MKINLKNMSLLESAAYVCGFLGKKGVNAVLVGGACVSVYTRNKYLSNDFDLVCSQTLKEVEPLLKEIGYRRKGRLFTHSESDFVLDFVPPPVMIAQQHITRKATIKTKFGQLNLLTPTDCVKDRLAGFYFWQDPQSLAQAVLIYKTQKNKIDVKDVKQWSKAEHKEDMFNIFLEQINL